MSSYFDPHDILADDTSVPCTFMYAVCGVAQVLDASYTTTDLPRDATVTLPLWLARPLHERNIGAIGMPLTYSDRFRQRADAGASCLNLRSSPYFYHVGAHLSTLTHDTVVASSLRQIFSNRYEHLLSGSLKAPDGHSLQQALAKLDTEEAQLYEAGRSGAAMQEQWWACSGCRLAPQQQPNKSAKRRRVEEEAETEKENQQQRPNKKK